MNNFELIKQMTVDEMALWITNTAHKTMNDTAELLGCTDNKYMFDSEAYRKVVKDYLLQEVEE